MADQLLTAAMEDRMTWKPISSAPRDGTSVIVYSKEVHDFDDPTSVSHWSEFNNAWCFSHYDRYLGPENPTHWMPLPEPPKETPDAP